MMKFFIRDILVINTIHSSEWVVFLYPFLRKEDCHETFWTGCRKGMVIQLSPAETQGEASYFYALPYGYKLGSYPAWGLADYIPYRWKSGQ